MKRKNEPVFFFCNWSQNENQFPYQHFLTPEFPGYITSETCIVLTFTCKYENMGLLPRKLEFVIEVAQPTLPTVLKMQILETGKTSCFYPFLGTRILGNRENTGVGYFTDRK